MYIFSCFCWSFKPVTSYMPKWEESAETWTHYGSIVTRTPLAPQAFLLNKHPSSPKIERALTFFLGSSIAFTYCTIPITERTD
ncbi:hypothetical protein XELAEV_18026498mg [Xenopus laevis]|uniref:Uncharacterized protein n=1 Tax=Xenopus laevis TaxID=8355 RepID=A0A974CW81_XENLA|nr:hypothetical protein XELAEV_18026498mg [Xenopus laevis]